MSGVQRLCARAMIFALSICLEESGIVIAGRAGAAAIAVSAERKNRLFILNKWVLRSESASGENSQSFPLKTKGRPNDRPLVFDLTYEFLVL